MSQVDEFDFNTYIIICAMEDTNLQNKFKFIKLQINLESFSLDVKHK